MCPGTLGTHTCQRMFLIPLVKYVEVTALYVSHFHSPVGIPQSILGKSQLVHKQISGSNVKTSCQLQPFLNTFTFQNQQWLSSKELVEQSDVLSMGFISSPCNASTVTCQSSVDFRNTAEKLQAIS